jgi:small subunit ribosomal protein S6
MRYYETLYIVNPNFEQDRLDKVMQDVTRAVQKGTVNILKHWVWGKKRLAYPIQKHKYGTYVLLQFEAEQVDFLKEFDQFMKLEKAVLRHQTIRLEKRPEVEGEEAEEAGAKPEAETAGEEKKTDAESTSAEAATDAPVVEVEETGEKQLEESN